MVNGFRYYTALESVSIASALSIALTIYPCQIQVHQRWQSKLQLPTVRKKEWRPATAGSSPHAVTCRHCDRHYFSRPRTATDRWSDALPVVPPIQPKVWTYLWCCHFIDLWYSVPNFKPLLCKNAPTPNCSSWVFMSNYVCCFRKTPAATPHLLGEVIWQPTLQM